MCIVVLCCVVQYFPAECLPQLHYCHVVWWCGVEVVVWWGGEGGAVVPGGVVVLVEVVVVYSGVGVWC